jgi:hypothetical protein
MLDALVLSCCAARPFGFDLGRHYRHDSFGAFPPGVWLVMTAIPGAAPSRGKLELVSRGHRTASAVSSTHRLGNLTNPSEAATGAPDPESSKPNEPSAALFDKDRVPERLA